MDFQKMLNDLKTKEMDRRNFIQATGKTAVAATIGLSLSSLITNAGTAQAAESHASITGRVLEDKNGKGIPGVIVSDGKTVTKTDKNGEYSIKVDPERRTTTIIFVTLPEGYTVSVNTAKTPQFFARLEGLQAGETRKQDIKLIRDNKLQGKKGKFVYINDIHVSKYWNPSIDVEKERFLEQIKQLNDLTYDADFIFCNGDYSDQGTVEEFKAYMDVTTLSSLMIWPSVGNHDVRDSLGDQSYKSYIDNYRKFIGPEWYSFDYRDYHIVVLENWIGQNEVEQLEWLKKDLAMMPENKKVIVMTHVPLNAPGGYGMGAYIELLRHYQVKLVLTGHYHSNDVDPNVFKGGVHVQTAPFWAPQDGSPEGFRIVRVGENGRGNDDFQGQIEDGGLSYEFLALGVDKRLEIVHPAPDQIVTAQDPFDIQVNAYDTNNEITKVRYQMDGKGWHSLKQVSSWTWAGDKEEQPRLTEGKHRIEVVVEAEKGESWKKSGTFLVVDQSKLNNPRVGTDWTCLHGNSQRSGYTKDSVTAPLRLAWTYKSKGSILASSPALIGGIAYIGIRDDNGTKNHGVVAIDVKTGKEEWRRNTAAPVEATPAVVEGVVYFSDIRGTVHAFDAKTGKTIWENRTGVESDGVQRAWTTASSAVDKGLLYQSLGYSLLVLDAKTGREIKKLRSTIDGHGGGDRQGAPLVSDGIVYFTGDGRYVIAFSTATGQELWKYYPKVPSRFRTGPSAADGRIYLRGEAGQVEVIDAKTGTPLWQYQKPFYNDGRGYIAIGDGSVIYPAGNYVVSVDKNTGQEQWSFQTDGGIEASPAISGNTVYVGSKDGNFYAIDRKTGKKVWQYTIGTWVNSSPAVSGNMVVVGAYDGNVYGFVEMK
ncbi:PQQ-binding-like beta-propeller repeat protein [Paenibacillus solisilvae]|uniref:PQQ-binding-like beta-propeller repeat protein n=1 Tax=Paenibacillus solisilvae TaxID=2486751 RepID=A0ABW0VZ04_9BACL